MNQAERYLNLVEKTKGKKLYSEYQAAFYLLSATQELCDVSSPYVSSDGISFLSIIRKAKRLSEPEQILISMAQNLFTYHSKTLATPYEISRLGYPYMELACNGIFIASGEAKVSTRSRENDLELYLDTRNYERTKQIHQEFVQFQEQSALSMIEDECER